MRVLLDANLLCLLAVGFCGPEHISKHKRLRHYTAEDLVNVSNACDGATSVIVCPHVLAEASNLVTFGCEGRQGPYLRALAQLMQVFEEGHHPSILAMDRAEYHRLGLTDAVLLELAAVSGLLITADLKLYLAAANAGYRTINYNHVLDRMIAMEDAIARA